MNDLAHPFPTTTYTRKQARQIAADTRRLADRILAGDYSAIPGDERFSDDEEWLLAAIYAADTGDYSEMSFMCSREIAFDEWCRLSERTQDAWAGFGNYFEKQRKRLERLPDLGKPFPFEERLG